MPPNLEGFIVCFTGLLLEFWFGLGICFFILQNFIFWKLLM